MVRMEDPTASFSASAAAAIDVEEEEDEEEDEDEEEKEEEGSVSTLSSTASPSNPARRYCIIIGTKYTPSLNSHDDESEETDALGEEEEDVEVKEEEEGEKEGAKGGMYTP